MNLPLSGYVNVVLAWLGWQSEFPLTREAVGAKEIPVVVGRQALCTMPVGDFP